VNRLMSSTLILPGNDLPENDPVEIREALEHQVDLVIDAGPVNNQPTTVVDLSGSEPVVVREGAGAIGVFR
jgi:tRNA A37 threonylcarbamoyladenosine synthetase subunit TsaC/SUA5/YrdC